MSSSIGFSDLRKHSLKAICHHRHMNKQWVYQHPDWLVTKTYPKSEMKHHLIWSYFLILKLPGYLLMGKSAH